MQNDQKTKTIEQKPAKKVLAIEQLEERIAPVATPLLNVPGRTAGWGC
jgi:hypothetical protein